MSSRLRLRVKDGESKPTREFSSKQEKQVAKTLGGKTTPNSGATPFYKGDVLLDLFLLECKTKTKSSDSISIKKEWIDKNNKEAVFMGKPFGSIVFSFGPDEPNYYVIDEKLMKYLIEKIKEDYEK